MSWAEERLGAYVRNGYIILPDGSSVDIETFETLFADAITAGGTYADFLNVDGGTKGYKDFFNLLKDEGLLN